MTVYIACCPFCKKHKLRTITKKYGFSVGCKSCSATGPTRGTMPAAIYAWNNAFKSLLSCTDAKIKFQAYLLNYPTSLTVVDDYQIVCGSDQFLAIEEMLEDIHKEFVHKDKEENCNVQLL